MHELETTKNFVWPYGICVPYPDRPDQVSRIAIAVWVFILTRSMEMARGCRGTKGAEDIADEVNEGWWKRTEDERVPFRDPKDFEPHISRVIKNTLYHHLRTEAPLVRLEVVHRKRPREVSTGVAPQDREVEVEDAALRCEAAMASLSPRQRQAFELTIEEKLTNAEAGVVMGISEETVKVHLKTGRRHLRQNAKKYLESER